MKKPDPRKAIRRFMVRLASEEVVTLSAKDKGVLLVALSDLMQKTEPFPYWRDL